MCGNENIHRTRVKVNYNMVKNYEIIVRVEFDFHNNKIFISILILNNNSCILMDG